jgi:hypothetical protein
MLKWLELETTLAISPPKEIWTEKEFRRTVLPEEVEGKPGFDSSV